VLEHVQEDDGVRARRRLVQLLERLLLELDPEALAPDLDGPLRRLDASSTPPCRAGGVEEEPHVRSDLEQAIPAHEIAAHDAQHPFEQLAPALLLAEVRLVHDLRVPLEDVVAGESGA
jgi:hypothetical protein